MGFGPQLSRGFRRRPFIPPLNKNKEIINNMDTDFQDISPMKKGIVKKIPVNIPDAHIDNISFHSVSNVERWKFVYQRRLALERVLGNDALECKEVMKLIKHAGLMKTVVGFIHCYEGLVKEFVVNIPADCDDKKSKEYRKVFVRGKCVEFSPAVINRYLGRSEEEQPEVEVTDNQVCK